MGKMNEDLNKFIEKNS